MDETKSPQPETIPHVPDTPAPDDKPRPRRVTADMELVDETRDRLAQRQPDQSHTPRRSPEQPPAEPWFLHPDERREFARLIETSRDMVAPYKQTVGPGVNAQILGQIEALCEALERALEADRVMQKEVHRLTGENTELLNKVARWQDYGEGRIPQPPGAETSGPEPESPTGHEAGESAAYWETLYRAKEADYQRVQGQLDECRLRLEKAKAESAEERPAHISYTVNFIAGRRG